MASKWFGLLEFILKDRGRELEVARLILSHPHIFIVTRVTHFEARRGRQNELGMSYHVSSERVSRELKFFTGYNNQSCLSLIAFTQIYHNLVVWA